ncbi:MAG: hypothetical protein ACI391_03485 [Muribaculaceae bacterium]
MRYIPLIIIALASLLTACVDNSPSGRLADALAAREMGDTAECLTACDALMLDSAAFNQLSPSQLCTLAEIFTSLETDAETADAQATRCIHRARTLNPDSVAEFLRTCPTDISMHLYTLMSVGASLDMPRDSLLRDDDFYHDSIPQ